VSRRAISREVLYPPSPDLAKAAALYSPAELFWIIKHGIKMTGMPAWNDHSDDELWTTRTAKFQYQKHVLLISSAGHFKELIASGECMIRVLYTMRGCPSLTGRDAGRRIRRANKPKTKILITFVVS
jgi:hypothetical protein